MHTGENCKVDDAPTVSHYAQGISYDGKIAGLYDLGETLGSGHFAVVKLAKHVFTGAKVAVKVVDKGKLDEVSRAHLFQEVRCMKLVQHPNVVRLYEVIDTQTKLYLVLELGDGGDLYDYIMKHDGGLNEQLARKYFRQILRAISYCHQLHVVHRDLKPENVVFFEKLGVVKLTDFGFSNKFSPGQKLETFCGSLAYSAPEILLGDSYDAPAVDIWSLGVILYMLVCGQPPFEKANDSETLTMIMDCKYTVPSQITQSCRELIGTMLVRDPKKRANLNEIAANPWLKDSDDCDDNEYLPLISHEKISEEDHAFIVQKMINGNIASKEDIIQSLDKNKYNHITATYFLLAEIRLRKRREEQLNSELKNENEKLEQSGNCPGDATHFRKQLQDKKNSASVSINIYPPKEHNSDTKTNKRTRKCSIVREEDEEDSNQETLSQLNELKVTVSHRESISDGRLNKSVQEKVNSSVMQGVCPPEIYGNLSVSTCASPPLHAHGEIDCGEGIKHDVESTVKKEKFNTMFNINNKAAALTHRRSKSNKIRSSSCSSSEASDDDTISRNKKKLHKLVGDTPTRFRLYRRDSYDDSSDSQEQSFSSSSTRAHMANIISKKANDDKKTENHSKHKEHNKSDDNRKSSNSQKSKKQLRSNAKKCMRSDNCTSTDVYPRRRLTEYRSLDRISEAQEYELRHKNYLNQLHNKRKHLLLTTSSNEANIKEECNELDELKALTLGGSCLNEKDNDHIFDGVSYCSKSSLGKIKFIVEDKKIGKTIQVNRTKCIVTFRNIRTLGKYFPQINLS